jgi:phytoene dehydrogenase-like protein
MIENPGKGEKEKRWKCELGPDIFQMGPLTQFGGEHAVDEFEKLREVTKGLVIGVGIPTMAMRPGASALIPLLRYFPTLVELLKQGPDLTGTFAPYMDGPKFVVNDQWLRDWLDALAFSLSGLPAARTSAAAMAFVLDDLHRAGAALDYPRGGLGKVIEALVRGLEQGNNKSKLYLFDVTPKASSSQRTPPKR